MPFEVSGGTAKCNPLRSTKNHLPSSFPWLFANQIKLSVRGSALVSLRTEKRLSGNKFLESVCFSNFLFMKKRIPRRAHAICRDVNYCKTSFFLARSLRRGKSPESQGSFLSASSNKFRFHKKKIMHSLGGPRHSLCGGRSSKLFRALMKAYIFQD